MVKKPKVEVDEEAMRRMIAGLIPQLFYFSIQKSVTKYYLCRKCHGFQYIL